MLPGILASGVASGQTLAPPTETSFNLQLFQPAPGPLNFFSVESPELGDDLKPSVGIWIGYQYRSFSILYCDAADNCEDGAQTIDAVKSFLAADVLASFNFLKYFQVGLAVPLTIYQNGQSFVLPKDNSFVRAGQDYTSTLVLSDLRLHLKVRFIGRDRQDGPSLAVAVIPSLPLAEWIGRGQSSNTGNGAYGYGGSSYLTVTAPKVLFGYRVGSLRVAANVGALWQKETELFSATVGHQINYGAALGYAIIPEVELIGELYGNKSLVSGNFMDSESWPLLFLGGGRFTAKDWLFNIAAGGGILSGIGVPQFQVMAGAAWAPGRDQQATDQWDSSDRDGDGIPNELDKCPDEPEDVDGFEDEDGCPDPDNDGDGILDGYDSCPNEPEDLDGFMDEDGCPDFDHDEDGIKEPDDKCPAEAEDFDGFEDEDGCPDPDNDGDGLCDPWVAASGKAELYARKCRGIDLCPNEPEDKDGFQDDDGCPDFDNDNDGVPDKLDRCPNEPETWNGFKDDDGCPDKGKPLVVITDEKIELKETILFETASDKIRGKISFELLDIVTQVLKGNPAIRVSIEGHTDNKGNAEANRELSKRRAESVKKYLSGKGIEENRMETKGWGPDNPIADNRQSSGRAVNRRVEFIIIQQVKKPATDAEASSSDAGAMDFTSDSAPKDSGGEMDFTAE
jgi:outer membrane protein OmpA-like peptidoglycan-associated protein